jgi:hypothetical protein
MHRLQQALHQAINDYAIAFNKPERWIERAYPTWEATLGKSHPKAILKAMESLITQPSEYPPKLNDVIGAVRKATVDLGLGVSHHADVDYKLCDDCVALDGWCQTVAHFTWTAPSADTKSRGYKQGEYYVDERMNICGCAGSVARLGSTNTRLAEERRIGLSKERRIELHAFHRSCADLPTLTHKERLKLDEWYALEERVEQAKREPQRGFQRIVNLLMNGNQAQRDALMHTETDQSRDGWDE